MLSRSCWCAQAGHQMSLCWAHGLLFVGAMCSHVDCLSPPILLLNHCFSGSSCVSLVTPRLSPYIVLLVSAVLCWSVVFRVSNVVWVFHVWLCPSLLPACLFFPFGLVFVLLCFILLLKITFPLHWVLELISLTHVEKHQCTQQIHRFAVGNEQCPVFLFKTCLHLDPTCTENTEPHLLYIVQQECLNHQKYSYNVTESKKHLYLVYL